MPFGGIIILSGDKMNYDEMAKIVADDMLEYKVSKESFIEVYEICLGRYGDFTPRETNKILTKAIHFITVAGYDINSINPCEFRKFMN